MTLSTPRKEQFVLSLFLLSIYELLLRVHEALVEVRMCSAMGDSILSCVGVVPNGTLFVYICLLNPKKEGTCANSAIDYCLLDRVVRAQIVSMLEHTGTIQLVNETSARVTIINVL